MIQRIQTVYLFLAAVLIVVCAAMPLATFVPSDIETPGVMYNLCIITPGVKEWDYSVMPLSVLLLGSFMTSVLNIFGYKNRRRQMKVCLLAMAFIVLWIALFLYLAGSMAPEGALTHYEYPAVMPLLALIFQWLARAAIKHDDDLVRAADRIR